MISETQNHFLLFSGFENLYDIFKVFKTKMSLIADVFSTLRTPENVVGFV